MTIKTPLLLIAWRRPHALRQVISAIRPLEPNKLYLACDGPNPERAGEAEKVAATRRVIEEEINWPCKIERLYSDVNQGCRLGVSRAISWFFDQVQEGIILEDDCVPHPSFFSYCSTLLERYRHDTRIWCISGNNFQDGQWRGDGSYYFSRYNHCWGWASWRRCWREYDLELKSWPSLRDSGLLNTVFDDPVECRFWRSVWQQQLVEGKIDTWDYQWTFSCLVNGGLTALPNRNLVSNIGFGADATHTTGMSIDTSMGFAIDPRLHPSFVLRDAVADRYTFDHHFGGKWYRFPRTVIGRPRRLAGKVLTRVRNVVSP